MPRCLASPGGSPTPLPTRHLPARAARGQYQGRARTFCERAHCMARCVPAPCTILAGAGPGPRDCACMRARGSAHGSRRRGRPECARREATAPPLRTCPGRGLRPQAPYAHARYSTSRLHPGPRGMATMHTPQRVLRLLSGLDKVFATVPQRVACLAQWHITYPATPLGFPLHCRLS